MAKEIVLTVVLKEETEGGYSIICPELDVASQGETVNDALKNIKEAIELYLETAERIGIMNEVLERLGLTREDLKKAVLVPKLITASIPVEITA